jgi:transcriptional regulator with XRE-family HTH domain
MSDPKRFDIDRRLNAIRAWVHYNGITPHQIAMKMGLSAGALRDMFKDTWNPKTSTLRAIEEFMQDHQRSADAAARKAASRVPRRKPVPSAPTSSRRW